MVDPSVPVTPEALLEHARFVRGLARALAGGAASAEDVEQETWLAALSRPPRSGRSLRGWLATVARNVARRMRRNATRVERRERRAARPEAVGSAARAAAFEEVVRGMSDALLRLSSTQRQVIGLRYYEGLPPREIARRLALPASTVKSCLRAALVRLRAELGATDHRPGGLVLAGALDPPGGLGFPAPGPLVTSGGLLMGTKAKVALAGVAVVLASAGIYLLAPSRALDEWAGEERPRGPVARDVTGSEAPVLRGAPKADGEGAGARGRPPGPEDEAGSVPKMAVPLTLAERWRVLGYEAMTPPDVLEGMILDGTEPVAVGRGLLWRIEAVPTTAGGIPAGKPPDRSALADRDGQFRFEGLEAGSWYLGVDLGDGVQRLHYRSRVTGGEPNPRALLGLGSAVVHGRVYDDQGRERAGVVIRVGASREAYFIAQTTTGADGTYRIDRLEPGVAWVTAALDGDLDDARTNRHRTVHLEAGVETEVSFGSVHGDPVLRGVLRCEDGEPVRGPGQIVLSRADPEGFLIVPYDAQGRYDQRVPAGLYQVRPWLPRGGPLNLPGPIPEVQIEGLLVERDFTLPGARIAGIVRAHEGLAAAVYVSISGPEASGEERAPSPGAGGGGVRAAALFPTPRHVRVAPDGTYAIYGVGPGRHTIHAWDGTRPQRYAASEPTSVYVQPGRAYPNHDLELRPRDP